MSATEIDIFLYEEALEDLKHSLCDQDEILDIDNRIISALNTFYARINELNSYYGVNPKIEVSRVYQEYGEVKVRIGIVFDHDSVYELIYRDDVLGT